MSKKVFVNQGNATWSATINTSDNIISNDTGVAFVRKNGGSWRRIEWFIVPSDVKDKILRKAA